MLLLNYNAVLPVGPDLEPLVASSDKWLVDHPEITFEACLAASITTKKGVNFPRGHNVYVKKFVGVDASNSFAR